MYKGPSLSSQFQSSPMWSWILFSNSIVNIRVRIALTNAVLLYALEPYFQGEISRQYRCRNRKAWGWWMIERLRCWAVFCLWTRIWDLTSHLFGRHEPRRSFCLHCSHVVVSGKSTLGFLSPPPTVAPLLLHPTLRLVVKNHMLDKKISFIWKWSLINLLGRKLCCVVSVKVRKTEVGDLGKWTDAHVQPWLASVEPYSYVSNRAQGLLFPTWKE